MSGVSSSCQVLFHLVNGLFHIVNRFEAYDLPISTQVHTYKKYLIWVLFWSR
uniref:Uncharacterized protein n=1 Tax=Podoviridae sp. ctXdu7 TaxID=2827618 RepID=A0A8S5RRU9_9CAUD|nr:MAG TPA: hypothetical protein [Podoviridae sp. ctXdu7]